MGAAATMLRYTTTIPHFLDCIWWIDEVVIWFVNNSCKVKVYADAHDQGVLHVVQCKNLTKGEQFKVRALCAVNALLGPCFIEFMTGTDGVVRRHHHPASKYKVGYRSTKAGTLF